MKSLVTGGIAKASGLDDGPMHRKAAIVKGKPLAMPPTHAHRGVPGLPPAQGG